MEMPKGDADAGSPLPRAREVYAALELRLAELLARARAQRWPGLEGDWAAFISAIDARVAFEEEVLLPVFGAHDPDRRALAKRLVEEHAALHQLLVELGRQIRRHNLRETTAELVAELLHEHAAIESVNIDPWIELDPRKWSLALQRVPT